MRCKVHVESNIPSFEQCWQRLVLEEVYDAKVDSVLKDLLVERGIYIEDVDDEADEDPEISETRQFAEDKVRNKSLDDYNTIISLLKDKFFGKDKITLYRAIEVKNADKYVKQIKNAPDTVLRPLGTSWAWDKEHATSYWGKGGKKLVFVAVADCQNIDFEETVLRFLLYGIYTREDDEENEIFLKEGNLVHLESIIIENDTFQIGRNLKV